MNVLSTVLSHWSRLSGWWRSGSDQQSTVVSCLTKMMLIDAKVSEVIYVDSDYQTVYRWSGSK